MELFQPCFSGVCDFVKAEVDAKWHDGCCAICKKPFPISPKSTIHLAFCGRHQCCLCLRCASNPRGISETSESVSLIQRRLDYDTFLHFLRSTEQVRVQQCSCRLCENSNCQKVSTKAHDVCCVCLFEVAKISYVPSKLEILNNTAIPLDMNLLCSAGIYCSTCVDGNSDSLQQPKFEDSELQDIWKAVSHEVKSATSAQVQAKNDARTAHQGTPFLMTSKTFGCEFEVFWEEESSGKGDRLSSLLKGLEKEKIECQIGAGGVKVGKWQLVRDSSIKSQGSCVAIELVSRVLEFGKEDDMEEVCRALKVLRESNAKVNESTGFHVHVGASDFSLDHFRNLVSNFVALEPFCDLVLAPCRRNSKYCKSNFEALGRMDALSVRRILSQCSNVDEVIRRSCPDRYFKLNLCSLKKHGTVEFRQHHG